MTTSDRHTVKPWFDGKLDYAPPVVDLAAAGFPLAGGRLDYAGGKPVAVLVYRAGRHWVDLFVRPAGDEGAEGAGGAAAEGAGGHGSDNADAADASQAAQAAHAADAADAAHAAHAADASHGGDRGTGPRASATSAGSSAPERRPAFAASSRRGFHLVRWTQAGMTFWAVSDLSPDRLLTFANRLAGELARDTGP